MEPMQFQDETDPEVIGIFEEVVNDYCARLEPSVFTRFPRALVIHDNQMVLVDAGQLLRVEEVRHSFTYSSSMTRKAATITLVSKPLIGPGPLIALHQVEFHSLGGIADEHGVWWLSPCESTLRIQFNCRHRCNRAEQVELHSTQVLRVRNTFNWCGEDDKAACIFMTHVKSVARVGQGWWPTISF